MKKRRLQRADVPDICWPTKNDLEVPDLDISKQGSTADVLPLVRWGSVSQSTPIRGAYHFYTGDEKFLTVWSNPHWVVNSGCRAVVEVNYSTAADLPVVPALWDIYRKRWLARWWQSQGVKVFVDLNVDAKFRALNLLGVPRGWHAYATRSHRGMGVEAIERDYETAVEHAAAKNVAFLVYGGGKAVQARCRDRGWLWVKEDIDRSRGR